MRAATSAELDLSVHTSHELELPEQNLPHLALLVDLARGVAHRGQPNLEPRDLVGVALVSECRDLGIEAVDPLDEPPCGCRRRVAGAACRAGERVGEIANRSQQI